jgi:hypothetical protein
MTLTKDERIAELEKVLQYVNGCCDLAMKHRDAAKRRADALERALRSYRAAALGFAEAVREDTQTAYPWHPLDEAEKEACAVLAQDGGRLDPYTLEWIARDCERCAEELCEAARENHRGCARGSYRDQEANHLKNEAHSLMKRAEYYRNLQPGQPADAGEPSCCARTREEALQNAANRCQDHGIEAAKEMMEHPAGSDKRERKI